MTLLHRDARETIINTRVGEAEITVRPEPPPTTGAAPVIHLRIDAPMLEALAAAYLTPDEARALAAALVRAADQLRPEGPADQLRPASPWRTPPPRRT